MLSESIYALRGVGLITAEKKRRPDRPTAKEVWHISIINIWKTNGEQHPVKKCSPSEQSVSSSEQSSQNVHTVSDDVHTVNKTTRNRSRGESKRSPRETEEENSKYNHSKEISVEEGDDPPTSSQATDSSFTPSDSPLSISNQEAEGVPPAGVGDAHPSAELGKKGSVSKPPGSDASPSALLQWLKDEHVVKSTNKAKVAEQMELLTPCIESRDELQSLCAKARGAIRGDNPTLYLGNLVSSLDAWLQEQERPDEGVGALGLGPEPLTEATYANLEAQIKREFPTLYVTPHTESGALYMIIWYGPTNDDFQYLRDRIDWDIVRSDAWIMEQAIAYGEATAQQPAIAV